MYYDDEGATCPCEVRDYGYEMSDVRSTLTINRCRCKDECVCTDEDRGEDWEECDSEPNCVCVQCGCECDHTTIKVKIIRIFDQECEGCNGPTYRCAYDVLLDDKVIKQFDRQGDADAYIAQVFPSAEPPERDYAWESEAGLRRAEGWG